MSSPSRIHGRRLPFFLLLPLLLAACSEDTLTPEDEPSPPAPDYLIERGPVGSGSAIGWSRLLAAPQIGAEVLEARYHVPGLPFRDRVEIRHEIQRGSFVHDWRLGREGGPWIDLRVTRGEGGDWAWVRRAWGDFEMESGLAPAQTDPVPVDPLSPLSLVLLAARWDEAGRPQSLDLPVLWIDLRGEAPDSLAASLAYEGEVDQDGIDALAFHLALPDGTLFFKLMAKYFPMPLGTWWDRDQLALRFWPGLADFSDLLFAPEFPPPVGYGVDDFVLDAGGVNLAVQAYRPVGDGPFPAILLVADEGPADRDDAALFGHLAHDLAGAGWLVYRYDKPGTGLSGGDLGGLDLDGRREAIDAAWLALRDDPDADPARCLLLGHGEGGALALERGAAHAEAAGVIALAAPFLDPGELPVIPEAIGAPGDYIDALGLLCFVDKYRDRLQFDPATQLSDPVWSERPVLLYRGDMDQRVDWNDLETQRSLLDAAGAAVEAVHWPGLDHFLNDGRPDDPPDADLVAALLDWLGENFGEAP